MKITVALTSDSPSHKDLFFNDFAGLEIDIPYQVVPGIGDLICLLDFPLNGAPAYWYKGECDQYDHAVEMLGRLWKVQSRTFYRSEIQLKLSFQPFMQCNSSQSTNEGLNT